MTTPALREVAGFTVLRELGRGGAGTVYLARQEALDRLVALKILHRDLASDEIYLQRFHREAKAAALFQHPNVVAVFDAGKDNSTGDYYIAFEYVDGGSVEQLLKEQGQLDENRALEITRAVAQALSFADSKGIVHRDVKPANLLLGKDGSIKLADLGLAKKSGPDAPQVTVEGLIVGTPYYMAPEQALGRMDLDHRVDIYSLGLCLWCTLTGRIPYLDSSENNTSMIHILSRRVTEELAPVNELSPKVSKPTAALIKCMTTRQRDDRYKSAGDVVRDIDLISRGDLPLGPTGNGIRMLQDARSMAKTQGVDADEVRGPYAPGVRTPVSQGIPNALRTTAAQLKVRAQNPGLVRTVGGLALGLSLLTLAVVGWMGSSNSRPARSEDPSPTEPNQVPTTQSEGTAPPQRPIRPDDQLEFPPAPIPLSTSLPEPPPTPPRTASSPAEKPAVDSTGINPLQDPTAVTPARVVEISSAFFSDPQQGERLLQLFMDGNRWQGSQPARRLVELLLAVKQALDDSRSWSSRARALRQVARLFQEQQGEAPLEGELGEAVMAELSYWGQFAQGILTLRSSITEPRLRREALASIRSVPANRGLALSADQFMGLIDQLDKHQRWIRLDGVRRDLSQLRREVLAQLKTNAVGAVLREEVNAVGGALEQLILDPKGCLVSALAQPSVLGLPESEYLRSRLPELSQDSGLNNNSGWGLMVQLDRAPEAQERLYLRVDDMEIVLHAHQVKQGSRVESLNWEGARRVFLEDQTQGVLLRIEGASDLMFPHRNKPVGPRKYTVRGEAGLMLQGVRIVDIPGTNASSDSLPRLGRRR